MPSVKDCQAYKNNVNGKLFGFISAIYNIYMNERERKMIYQAS